MVGRLLVAGCVLTGVAQAQSLATGYRVGVVSESGDIVTWLAPNGSGLILDRVVPVGIMPSDIDGPHNITVSPDGKNYYVTIAHGTPYGSLWKLNAMGDSLAGRAQVELFPTTISVTPDCLSRNSLSHNRCRACGSSPVVGSSSSSSSGSLISERAMVSRRFMPPESGST